MQKVSAILRKEAVEREVTFEFWVARVALPLQTGGGRDDTVPTMGCNHIEISYEKHSIKKSTRTAPAKNKMTQFRNHPAKESRVRGS